MAHLIVGTDACPIMKVLDILTSDKELYKKWVDVATHLDVPWDTIEQNKREFLLGFRTHQEVYHSCLVSWRSKKVDEATLQELTSVLRKLQLNAVAENLLKEFKVSLEASLKWANLSKDLKATLLERKITVQQRITNLKTIFDELAFNQEAIENFMQTNLNEKLLTTLHRDQNPVIFEVTLPIQIPYYIERTFIPRGNVSLEIFKNNSEVILVSGIEPHGLSRLAGKELTDTARSQAKRRNLSVRFMLLELKSDFEDICAKTDNTVHWLQYKDGVLSWIQTRGNLSLIRNHVVEEEGKIEEVKLLENIGVEGKSTNPVVISESPGMGKTKILANLGRHLQVLQPEKLVIFIVLNSFISKVKKLKDIPNNNIQKVLLEFFCKTPFESNLGQLYFKLGQVKMELLFDGLDEVDSADTDLALGCLKILNSLPSVRVWITTRPHYRHILENTLHQLAHHMFPFNPENQIKFLVQFWSQSSSSRGIHPTRLKLYEFAEACLAELKKTMTDVDSWAGIPLQCLLIAQVFAKDAINFANPSNNMDTIVYPEIIISSLNELFERVVKKKLELFSERYPEFGELTPAARNRLEDSHIFYAFKAILPDFNVDEVQIENSASLETLLKVGLLETSANDETPHFIHLTFAEYFLAKYLHRLINDKRKLSKLDFLFDTVKHFDEDPISLHHLFSHSFSLLAFKFPVVINFLNSFLDESPPPPSCSLCFSESKMEESLGASIFSNFMSIFSWLIMVPKSSSLLTEDNLYLAAGYGDISFIEKILSICQLKDDWREERLDKLLNVAALRGRYQVFEYLSKYPALAKTLEPPDNDILFVVLDCIKINYHFSEVLVKNKNQILSAILEINPMFLQGKSEHYFFGFFVGRGLFQLALDARWYLSVKLFLIAGHGENVYKVNKCYDDNFECVKLGRIKARHVCLCRSVARRENCRLIWKEYKKYPELLAPSISDRCKLQ